MADLRAAVGELGARPTLDDLFQARVAVHPDAEALRFVSRGEGEGARAAVAVSWRTLATRAAALARGLETLGPEGALPEAARVVILADTRLEWVLVDLACVMAGLISVPLFPNVEPATLERVLVAADAQVVVAENPWQARKLIAVADALPRRPALVLIDEVMTLASGAHATLDELGPSDLAFTSLADLEYRGQGRSLHQPAGASRAAVEPDACWTICYTPGTEGQPKGVMWTHDNLDAATRSLARSLHAQEGEGGLLKTRARGRAEREAEVVLVAMPLAQALARVALWSGLAARRDGLGDGPPPVTALPRSEATLFEDAAVLRPTVMMAVPSVYERARSEVMRQLRTGGAISGLVSRWAAARIDTREEATIGERLRRGIATRVIKPALARRFGDRCRALISGGAPLAEGVQGFYQQHGLALRECYGMVETAALTHLDREVALTPGSVGAPLPGVEQRLGTDGELFVRGPVVSPGYWRDPAETAKVFDAEGWFATGDLARVDERGRLFITGRKREIIALATGRTLAPRPIEAALCEEPLVAQAYVHGEGREFATALIALEREELTRLAASENLAHLDFEALSRHPVVHARINAAVQRVNQHLPPHAALKKHAILPSELTAEPGALSPTMTLRRRHLAERFRSLLDSFYAESF